MRKAFFCLVLVAASFAGGAAVNGPGLNWAKAMIMDRLGLNETGEPRPALPTDSIPPLAVEPSEVGAGSPATSAADPAPEGKDPAPDRTDNDILATANGQDSVKGRADGPAASKVNTNAPESTSVKKASAAPAESAPALDPLAEVKAKAKELPALAPVPAPDPKDGPLPLPDPSAPKVSATSEEPVKALPVEPTDAAVSATANAPAAAADANAAQGDWSEIRRLLKAAGVSRFTIDGELTGRVRFQCVIPVAGRRAVGQHFEAEGDDEIQAARAALKRITLWRASEDQTNAP
jgi:hypothetical protein